MKEERGKRQFMQNTIRINFMVLVLTVLLSLFSCTTKPGITETPPPTLTGILTLSPQKAYPVLEDLLTNDCGLPCFAGITPGETLLIDASKTLLPFNGISDWTSLSEKGGQIGINYPKDDLVINLFFQILSSKHENRVQLLNVFTEALREVGQHSYQWVYDAKHYHEMFGAYSLQNVLTTYGKPSEIYMTVEINEAEYNSPDFVLLWLMYPKKGFIAKYTTNAEVVDGIVHGCPSKTFVELWLFPPYSDERYKEDLLPFDMELGYVWPTPSIRTKPISQGIDMSLEEFYQMFSQPTNQCLDTPRSTWPEF